MASEGHRRRLRPGRTLYGYRDIGAAGARHSRRAVYRAWAILLVLITVLWIRDYRSTHPQTGISPLDRWGGYTTEAAGRVPVFFWIVTVVIVAFGAEFVIGHLISGQRF